MVSLYICIGVHRHFFFVRVKTSSWFVWFVWGARSLCQITKKNQEKRNVLAIPCSFVHLFTHWSVIVTMIWFFFLYTFIIIVLLSSSRNLQSILSSLHIWIVSLATILSQLSVRRNSKNYLLCPLPYMSPVILVVQVYLQLLLLSLVPLLSLSSSSLIFLSICLSYFPISHAF